MQALRLVVAPPTPALPPSKLPLYDPLVADMADIDHQPTEEWPSPAEVRLTCGTCRQVWPCETRRELRAQALEEW